MFSLFSKPAPQTNHQRRDKMLSLSETRVSSAEAMLDRALTHKQNTVTCCIKEETSDLADLAAQMKTAEERLDRLKGMVSGTIDTGDDTDKTDGV